MKKIVTILSSVLLFSGCSFYTPLFMSEKEVEHSLNLCNSEWDDFSGRLKKGKTYHYSNKGFHKNLRITVLQRLSDTEILAYRPTLYGSSIVEERAKLTIFHIISNETYADGASLQNGDYVCIGTYQYTTREDKPRSVYSLIEKSLYSEHVKSNN